MLSKITQDASISAISAGFIAVLIGFSSSIAIVFQAAQASGANVDQMQSWVWALGLGMGITSFALSLYYKAPLIIAWSTPGAALLATSLSSTNLAETTGTFLVVGALIVAVGMTGLFGRISQMIPMPIAAAMLAGVLVQFGLGLFDALANASGLVATMLMGFLLFKRVLPRYAVALVLVIGMVYVFADGTFQSENLRLEIAKPVWVMPEFSLNSIIGIGVPLFIVTMTSQNLPGVAILKSSGYESQAISPLISTTGFTTLIMAPFGGFTFNLAAITAAVCTSDESHPDKDRRYIAGLSAGVFNCIAGIFGASIVGLFIAFPKAFVAALAGLALLSTLGNSFNSAFEDSRFREPAILTFLLTASGLSFFGISSAFWGLMLGMLSIVLLVKK